MTPISSARPSAFVVSPALAAAAQGKEPAKLSSSQLAAAFGAAPAPWGEGAPIALAFVAANSTAT
jgi:hypothetical protein